MPLESALHEGVGYATQTTISAGLHGHSSAINKAGLTSDFFLRCYVASKSIVIRKLSYLHTYI